MCQFPLNPAISNQSHKQPVLLPLHEPFDFNAFKLYKVLILQQLPKRKRCYGYGKKASNGARCCKKHQSPKPQ